MTRRHTAAAALLAAVLAALIGGVALVTLRPRLSRDPLVKVYASFCARLAAVGPERSRHETASRYLERIAGALDPARLSEARRIVAAYEQFQAVNLRPPARCLRPRLHRRPRQRARLATLATLAAIAVALATAASPADAQRHTKRAQAPRAAALAAGYSTRDEVMTFVAEMVDRHGFVESELLGVFAQARRSDEAVRLISPAPPGFKRSWQTYRARFLDGLRIREGLRFWREHETWLELAATRFGVPPEIVVAIIGVETLYGRITGEFRVLDVLTCRRIRPTRSAASPVSSPSTAGGPASRCASRCCSTARVGWRR